MPTDIIHQSPGGDYALLPAGSIVPFAGANLPSGLLECNGAQLLKTAYPSLYSAIGNIYGQTDGSGGAGTTHFKIPDYRGWGIRGYDHGAGNDPDAVSRTDRGDGATGDAVGTAQNDALQGHTFDFGFVGGGLLPGFTTGWIVGDIGEGSYDTGAPVSDGAHGTPRISSESRMKNKSVLFCIKY